VFDLRWSLARTCCYLYAASCDGFQCGGDGFNKVCRIRHGQPRCVCAADCRTLLRGVGGGGGGGMSRGRSGVVRERRSATISAAVAASWHGPVCSFDGRTHRNLCALAKSNCRSRRELPVDYIGPCQSQFVTLSLAAEFSVFNLKLYYCHSDTIIHRKCDFTGQKALVLSQGQ